jgi:hypothetical protein
MNIWQIKSEVSTNENLNHSDVKRI